MKTKQLLSLALLTISIMLIACINKTGNTPQVAVNIDSLEAQWDKAWNTQDVQALKNILADSAVVFENEFMVTGRDSLMEKFVKPNFKGLKNMVMTTTKVVDGMSEGMVFRVGEYVFKTKDSAKTDHKGPFTLIWKKQADKTWKVEVMQTGTIEETPIKNK